MYDVMVFAVGRQLGVALAAVGAALQDDRVGFFKMPMAVSVLLHLRLDVMAIRATRDGRDR